MDALVPQVLVQVDEDSVSVLVVKAVAGALELRPELPVVVDLTVQDDDNGAILVVDWLVAALKVDDGKALDTERCPLPGEVPRESGPRWTMTSHIRSSSGRSTCRPQ
jgi:hypothetical protein